MYVCIHTYIIHTYIQYTHLIHTHTHLYNCSHVVVTRVIHSARAVDEVDSSEERHILPHLSLARQRRCLAVGVSICIFELAKQVN